MLLGSRGLEYLVAGMRTGAGRGWDEGDPRCYQGWGPGLRGGRGVACKGGVCGTCRAKLVEGTVAMDANYALEPDEVERGYVLTCQSHPTSPKVVLDYDA